MLKRLIGYLDMRVFLTFYTCSLTPLESNLTKVTWVKEFEGVTPLRAQIFLIIYK